MATTDSDERFVQRRRDLDIQITRAENVVSIIRQEFKSDDFEMVDDMVNHLKRAAEAVQEYAQILDMMQRQNAEAG